MRKTLQMTALALLMLVAMSVMAEKEQAGKAPCQCRDRDGLRQDLGSVDCFDISGKSALFRCEMSTNTPYWKRIDSQDGCPLAFSATTPRWLNDAAVAKAN